MELLLLLAITILLVVATAALLRLAPRRLLQWVGAAVLAYLLVGGVIYALGIYFLQGARH